MLYGHIKGGSRKSGCGGPNSQKKTIRLFLLLSFFGPHLILQRVSTGPRSAVGNVSGYRCVSDCNPGVTSSIPARSHTFVEIDHEIISTVILLPSADSFKKGYCQLQAKVCARITGYPLVQACPGKVLLGELTVPQ